MNESAQGERSGSEVYEMLWHAQNSAHKRVYILASHSHFYMENIFDTPDWKGKVLPGLDRRNCGSGSLSAPAETGPSQHAMTDIYGYLDRHCVSRRSHFVRVPETQSRKTCTRRTPEDPNALVGWCFEENKQ